jgi:hypothetical protein
MELSSEDSLRLNVLLANARAIRIDDNRCCVYGLAEHGEVKVQLNPNARVERYLKSVRELLSSAVLGSPGGYPVFLKRWTRMGQLHSTRLDDLLMLGEPEAVVAVAGSPHLTDDLASRAWWAMTDATNARRMLACPDVVQGKMGKVLAAFLLEFLPFEEDPLTIIESVRLILQPGLVSEVDKLRLWQKGKQKSVFLVGFLHATPDDLPEPVAAHADYASLCEALGDCAGNPCGALLMRVLSAPGQGFVQAAITCLQKPSNQDVVISLLGAMAHYFANVRASTYPGRSVDELIAHNEALLADAGGQCPETLRAVLGRLDRLPGARQRLIALLTLADVGERYVWPVFAHSDSVGSLMRKKLEPVSRPLLAQLNALRG